MTSAPSCHTESPWPSIAHYCPLVKGSYREQVLMAPTNWFRVGGYAQLLYRPSDAYDLSNFMKNRDIDIPVTILGVGSNVLIRDGGIEGVVIKLGRDFMHMAREDNAVIVGASALDFNVSQWAKSHSIGGLEFLSGIPGTIGGAIAMNAGAYGSEIKDCLEWVDAIDEHGDVHRLTPYDIGFIYRGHTLPGEWIFTQAKLRGYWQDPTIIDQRMTEIAEKRAQTQPVRTRTSGSTFANPPGHHRAWELIDQAGCRGLTIGDAQISTLHCNFMINLGNATAHDLELLGETVRQRVLEKSNILLEWEVKRIGAEL
jgi:UDP-N-acetylmuramate dehydrogenase